MTPYRPKWLATFTKKKVYRPSLGVGVHLYVLAHVAFSVTWILVVNDGNECTIHTETESTRKTSGKNGRTKSIVRKKTTDPYVTFSRFYETSCKGVGRSWGKEEWGQKQSTNVNRLASSRRHTGGSASKLIYAPVFNFRIKYFQLTSHYTTKSAPTFIRSKTWSAT
jgi:hypothetical protein